MGISYPTSASPSFFLPFHFGCILGAVERYLLKNHLIYCQCLKIYPSTIFPTIVRTFFYNFYKIGLTIFNHSFTFLGSTSFTRPGTPQHYSGTRPRPVHTAIKDGVGNVFTLRASFAQPGYPAGPRHNPPFAATRFIRIISV